MPSDSNLFSKGASRSKMVGGEPRPAGPGSDGSPGEEQILPCQNQI